VSLCFQIKLLNALRVVYSLRVDFFVTNDDAFPDGFIGLLEVNLKELAVFDTPEAVFDLDLLAKFTLQEWFLTFECACDMLSLYLDI